MSNEKQYDFSDRDLLDLMAGARNKFMPYFKQLLDADVNKYWGEIGNRVYLTMGEQDGKRTLVLTFYQD